MCHNCQPGYLDSSSIFRRLPLNDLNDRKLVEDLYITLTVGSKVGHDVAKVLSPAMLLAGCAEITIATFMSLTNLQLWLLLQACYTVGAVVSAGILFDQIYECVSFTQESQQIIERLVSMEQSHLRGMTRKEREAAVKKAKAFRPVLIPIGGFCNVSMAVLEVSWEEILNQVLFLLSM